MRRTPALLLAVVAAATALPVLAMGTGGVEQAVDVVEPAVRTIPLAPEALTVSNVGPLQSSVSERAFAAAQAAGGTAVVGRSASLGLRSVRRGETFVQAAEPGFAYPMGTTVLPREAVASIMSAEIADAMTSTTVVMGQLSAELRGAEAGDLVDLVAANGSTVTLTIGLVANDAVTGGTELLINPEVADLLGISRLSRVVMWGFDSRAAIEAELAARDLINTSIRVNRSWSPRNPDSTLGMAQTKAALGEFAYRVNPSGSVSVDSDWRTTNITSGRIGRLTLVTGCHRTVRLALQNAMSELISSGLEFTLNYFHANTAGGCYFPRFNRLTPNSSIGFLSRHSWGMAVDTNTIGSCQGCAPPDMDCRTVQIFRKHGFAWGGNFLRPDGMHFEWVGEPRDHLPFPSRFCQTPATNAAGSRQAAADALNGSVALDITETQWATVFAGDGLVAEG